MKITRKRYVYARKGSGELNEGDFILITDEFDTDELQEGGKAEY